MEKKAMCGGDDDERGSNFQGRGMNGLTNSVAELDRSQQCNHESQLSCTMIIAELVRW